MKKISSVFSFIAILAIAVILYIFPLFKPGFIVTDDGDWMIIRLTAFYQSFADGQFPVRFLGRLNNNFGYPVSNFLYPGFLYFGSILRLFRIPYPSIIELIFILSINFGTIGMFLWLRKFFKDLTSFFGALSFLLSPYLFYDLYKRGSVGELMATSAVIVTCWAIEAGYVWLLSPIVAILLISHNTLAFLYCIFLIFYIITRKKFNTILPCVIGVVMTSFFWLPAIFEQSFVSFNSIQVANPFDYKLVSHQLFFMSLPFYIPLVLFFIRKKIRFYNEFILFAVVLCISGTLSTVIGSVFWNMFWFNRFIQFPYRILSLLLLAGPWMFSFFIDTLHKNKSMWVGSIIIVIFVFMGFPYFKTIKSTVHEEGFYTTNEGTTTVQDEYMPRWVSRKSNVRANAKLVIFSGKGTINTLNQSTKKIEADILLEEDSVIQFNTVFYPGWGVILDGKPIDIRFDNPQGLMHVAVPQGAHHIIFEFRETVFRFIADTITGVGVLIYGIYLVTVLIKKPVRQSTKKKTI